MSEKLQAALLALEKARVAALDVAIAERKYRVCAALDSEGGVQKAIDRVRKIGATPKPKLAKKNSPVVPVEPKK